MLDNLLSLTSIDLGNKSTIEVIKQNLRLKKLELSKENSLFNEVRDYFPGKNRLTFYHLGLYKLYLGFSSGGKLSGESIIPLISILKVNDLCKLFTEGKLGNSDTAKEYTFLYIVGSIHYLKEENFSLYKSLYQFVSTKKIKFGRREQLSNFDITRLKDNFYGSLIYLGVNEKDISIFDLDSIEYDEIDISNHHWKIQDEIVKNLDKIIK